MLTENFTPGQLMQRSTDRIKSYDEIMKDLGMNKKTYLENVSQEDYDWLKSEVRELLNSEKAWRKDLEDSNTAFNHGSSYDMRIYMSEKSKRNKDVSDQK